MRKSEFLVTVVLLFLFCHSDSSASQYSTGQQLRGGSNPHMTGQLPLRRSSLRLAQERDLMADTLILNVKQSKLIQQSRTMPLLGAYQPPQVAGGLQHSRTADQLSNSVSTSPVPARSESRLLPVASQSAPPHYVAPDSRKPIATMPPSPLSTPVAPRQPLTAQRLPVVKSLSSPFQFLSLVPLSPQGNGK